MTRPAVAEPVLDDVHAQVAASTPALPVPGDGRRIGCDVVDVERFARLLARRPALRDQLFTAAEQADAVRGGVAPDHPVAVRRLAARFAAKEALAKAWRRPALAWTDVAVLTEPSGAPAVRVHGHPVPGADVSLAHDGPVAMAVVLAPPTPLDLTPRVPVPDQALQRRTTPPRPRSGA